MIKKIFVMFFTCFSFLLFTCVANASVTHIKDNTGETKTIKAENVQITTDQEILSEPSKINFINEIEKEDYIKHLKQGHKIIQRG
ncbi:MAG: hypothetical protein QJR05_14220, partial [Thermoanaerobacterium sp.]|nr:hypothetical protein [Thermoanaerobacterium sp.]